MRRPRREPLRLTLTVLLIAVAISACTAEGTDEAATVVRSPAAVETATPAPTAAGGESDAETRSATLVASAPLEVRVGPGSDAWPVRGTLPAGKQVEVIGRWEPRGEPRPDPPWLALEGLGWIAYDTGSATLAEPVDSLRAVDVTDVEVAGPLHPAGTRSGVDAVDEVLALVEAMDIEALAALVMTEERRCSPLWPEQSPDTTWPCPEGRAPGELVTRFGVSACHGDSLPADAAEAAVASLFEPQPGATAEPLRVYFIAQSPWGYEITLAYTPTSIYRTLRVEADGGIGAVGFGCGNPLPSGVNPEWPLLTPPYAPPPLLPIATANG